MPIRSIYWSSPKLSEIYRNSWLKSRTELQGYKASSITTKCRMITPKV